MADTIYPDLHSLLIRIIPFGWRRANIFFAHFLQLNAGAAISTVIQCRQTGPLYVFKVLNFGRILRWNCRILQLSTLCVLIVFLHCCIHMAVILVTVLIVFLV